MVLQMIINIAWADYEALQKGRQYDPCCVEFMLILYADVFGQASHPKNERCYRD